MRRRAPVGYGARFIAQTAAARLSPGPIRSILFSASRPDWHPVLRSGCRAAGYRSTFAPLTPAGIAEHDLVVPLTIADLYHLSEMRGLVERNPIPIPTRPAVAACDDKLLFAETLTANGFGAWVPAISDAPEYPYILKRSVDEGSTHCHLVTDRSGRRELAALAADPRYFAQAFVTGHREYTTHLVMRDRRVLCAMEFEFTYATTTPIKLKDRPIHKRIRRSPHLDLFASILNSVGFEGLCCVNYKSDQGHPWILEINPRMGGSLGRLFFSFVRRL